MPSTIFFGCRKCHSFYPTLERALEHLRHSPAHTGETQDLLDRTLISFTLHTAAQHAAAIAAVNAITVRVSIGTEDFTFPFARDRHTSVAALLRGVEDVYTGRADVGALAQRRLMMRLARRSGEAVGGRVRGDADVVRLCGVVGEGWMGFMEIG